MCKIKLLDMGFIANIFIIRVISVLYYSNLYYFSAVQYIVYSFFFNFISDLEVCYYGYFDRYWPIGNLLIQNVIQNHLHAFFYYLVTFHYLLIHFNTDNS